MHRAMHRVMHGRSLGSRSASYADRHRLETPQMNTNDQSTGA
jgi:hypothetical protein